MQTKVPGLILIIIGVIMIAYNGFNYQTTEKLVEIGPVQIETKKNNFVELSPYLGAVLLVAGIFLLLRTKKVLA
ncbi:MAG: hypothetical protein IPM92_04345 [Saprospiraceae bacterium]|nr:hypothetical protein [Saprospiraceae bacterium]